MNELVKQLSQVVELTKNGLIKTTAIVQAQIPDIVHQILKWELISSILGAILFLILFGICVKILYLAHKQTEEDAYPDDIWLWLPIVSGVGGVASLIASIVNLFQALEIWIAPKVYLIDYLKSLMGK